ncbi:synaptotagmin-like protein 4 isoform X9 [Watersipora subatra]|uniref:synaptotagmin-like protein 4 isoform X9 n=1 Tax=Watersipora subatra TaxID=2589382 RepID=UPI00355C3F70
MSGVHLDFELDLDFLSVEERDIILAVLKRDEALRKAEQERKSDLKNEISQLRQQSALRVGSQQKNRQCIRCQQEFGILFKKGEVCVKCKHRICMNCRVNIGNSSTFAWLCSLCYKQRLLPAVAGDWFYSKVEERHKYDINALHGSDVVRSSIRRSRHLTEEDQDRLKNLTGRSNPFDEDASPPGANNKSKPRSGNESPTYVHAADSRVVRRVRSKGLRNSSSSSGGSSSEEESEEVKSRQKQLLRKLSNTSSEEGEPEQSDTSHANSRTGSSKDDLDGTKRPGTNTEQREFAAIQQAQAELRGASSISDGSDSLVSSGFDVFGLPGSGPLDHLRCTLCAEHFGGKPPHQNAAVTEELKKKLADRQLRYSPVDNTSMGNQPESETSSMGRKGSLAPEIVVSVAQSEAAVDSDDPMCHSMDDIDDFDIESPAFKARKTGRKSSQLSNTLTVSVEELREVSTESITSALSEAGADYSKHDITGDLKLSVAFDKPTGLLTLTIHECRDLVAVNKKKNISDPYVKAYLVSGSQKFNKRKTRIVKGTVNPVFEETFTYTLSHSDMYTKTLQISVWNNHRLGHKDFLGEVNIVFNAAFEGTAGQARWLNLGKKVENNADILPPSAPDLGIALKYVPTRVIPKKDAKDKVAKAELHVKLLCARNLPTKKHGMYDPYAKCVMLPEKAKQKTATVKNDLNPVWDETFTFPKKTTSELRESSLEISVIDYDRFSANDLIGTVKLNLGKGKAGGKEVDWMSASEPAKELWDNMIRTPGEWQEGWLPIDLVVKPE